MILEQQMVEEFHKAFEILRLPKPGIPDKATKKLRIKLIKEELNELKRAFSKNDLVQVADGLADVLYVVYGTAVSCGIDMDPIFKEVHRSNMSKVGGHKRKDGKWVKPVTYSKPNLEPILKALTEES